MQSRNELLTHVSEVIAEAPPEELLAMLGLAVRCMTDERLGARRLGVFTADKVLRRLTTLVEACNKSTSGTITR